MTIGTFSLSLLYFLSDKIIFVSSDCFMFGLYTNQESARIILEIIDELDQEKRKLVLLQLKLDIESNYYDRMDATHDWELKRYYNITNERVVTIEGYCLECRSKFPFEMDIIEFLGTGSHPKCYSPDGALFQTVRNVEELERV